MAIVKSGGGGSVIEQRSKRLANKCQRSEAVKIIAANGEQNGRASVVTRSNRSLAGIACKMTKAEEAAKREQKIEIEERQQTLRVLSNETGTLKKENLRDGTGSKMAVCSKETK
jgi:hypothetical protein